MMAEMHVVSQLRSKYGELEGEIRLLEENIQEKKKDRDAIARSLLVFDPHYPVKTISPKKKRNVWAFKPGELKRMILDCIKENGESAQKEIVDYIRGLKSDFPDAYDLDRGVENALRNMVKQDELAVGKPDKGRCRYDIKSLV